MTSTRSWGIALTITALMAGCQGATEESVADVDVGENRSALWSYPYRGGLAYGQTARGRMSAWDFGERYAYAGTRGERVTFVVEWDAPATTYHGAEIWLEDRWGYDVAKMVTWERQAHIDVTIPEDGTYALYVAHHGFDWFGSFPYTVGAAPHMCARLFMTNSLPEWAGFEYLYVEDLPPGAELDPFTLMPGNPDLVVTRRVVTMAHCNTIVDGSCAADAPEVCGATLAGSQVFANACALRDHVTAQADNSGSIGAWTADLGYCAE
jgi:hypothetical protein